MRKKLSIAILFLTILLFSSFISFTVAKENSTAMSRKLRGQILIQVEDKGKAWYVNPEDNKRYYLGTPADVFNIMKQFGLGVDHKFILAGKPTPTPPERGNFSSQMLGKILIDVNDNGKAYYIYPKDQKAYYLGRPNDAFTIMKNLGLGITDANIKKIEIGKNYTTVKLSEDTKKIGMQIFDLTNNERTSRGLAKLKYNPLLAEAAQDHCQDMVDLNYFDHNRPGKKFYEFAQELGVDYNRIAENIATGFRTPETTVTGWMNSQGHREAILGDYQEAGVGLVIKSNGGILASTYFKN